MGIKSLMIALMAALGINGMNVYHAAASEYVRGIPVIHNSARWVENAGPIMSVDAIKGQLVVNEIRHVVGVFVVNEKVYNTIMVDDNGDTVDVDSFVKGQWVRLRGYRVAKSIVYLSHVYAVNGAIAKEERKINKLEPIVPD